MMDVIKYKPAKEYNRPGYPKHTWRRRPDTPFTHDDVAHILIDMIKYKHQIHPKQT